MNTRYLTLHVLSLLTALWSDGRASSGSAAGTKIAAWIDPGHGANDKYYGATCFNGGQFPDEKDLNLQVAQRVQTRLGQLGYFAFLTRYDDRLVGRTERTLIAAGLADNHAGEGGAGVIFVSVHMDGVDDPSTHGTFVMYPSKYKSFKKSLASYRVDSTLASWINPALQSGAAAAFLGCHQPRPLRENVENDKQVLKVARIPSVLVECCFCSNQCQFDNIRQGGDQALVANGIATGISQYLGQPVPQDAARTRVQANVPRYVVVGSVRTAGLSGLHEDFEAASFPPPGWTVSSSGSTVPHTWHRSTDPLYVEDVPGSTGAALVQGESPSAIDEWLISPTFLVSAPDSALRFRWLGNPNFSADVPAACLIKRPSDVTWTTVWSLAQESGGLVFSFPERAVTLASWLGDSVQVAFRLVGTNGADFGLDNIETGAFSPTQPAANDKCLSATPIPSGSFSFSGSTCYAVDDVEPRAAGFTCVTEEAGGPDVFYSVAANAGDTLIATISASSAEYSFLYLMNSCDMATASCVAGMSPVSEGHEGSLTHVFGASGTYLLVLDPLSGTCGEFVLSVSLRGPVTAVAAHQNQSMLQITAVPNPTQRAVSLQGRVASNDVRQGEIGIYDAAGRRVWRTSFKAIDGRFAVQWDGRLDEGSRARSGVYTARVRLGQFRASATLVLID